MKTLSSLLGTVPCLLLQVQAFKVGLSDLHWNLSELFNLSIHQRIGIKTSLGFFHNWDPLYVLLWHFDILREVWGNFPCGKNLRQFSREKRGKYPHRKFSFISPEFPQGNYEEISTEIIPWNCHINPCGNRGGGWLARWVLHKMS